MKKRLPGTEKAVKELFAITLNGQFRAGDTIGIWTFGKDLRTGQFPLEHWEPQDVMSFPMEVLDFVKNQHYSKTTSFDTMMQLLDKVVLNSPRLTTVIFCDGNGEIKGTPYDAQINALFKQNQAAMQKAEEPFIIILRSQFGKYVGYSVSRASGITLPQFPPLPKPVIAEPAKVPPPQAPMPQPTPPSLIIVGSKVGTNLPAPMPTPAPAAPVPPPQSNPVVPASPQPQPMSQPNPPLSETPAPETNATSPSPTNVIVAATPEATPPPAAQMPATSPQPDSSSSGKGRLFAIGACFLALAGVWAFVVIRSRSGRQSPSLITESLKKR